MVILWIPNSLTSLANFSFSLNLLKICIWWNATFIIPFFFVLIISWYCLIISAAFSGSSISLASLFKSSNSRFLSMIIESNNCFLSLLLINVSLFYYLPRLFISVNKKIITIVPNLKQKCLSKLLLLFFFFCKFGNKKKNYLTTVILSFPHPCFKALSINSFVSGNILLTAFETAKAICNRFLSILTTRACSLIFYFSALCSKKYLKLFYTHLWRHMGYRALISFLKFQHIIIKHYDWLMIGC